MRAAKFPAAVASCPSPTGPCTDAAALQHAGAAYGPARSAPHAVAGSALCHLLQAWCPWPPPHARHGSGGRAASRAHVAAADAGSDFGRRPANAMLSTSLTTSVKWLCFLTAMSNANHPMSAQFSGCPKDLCPDSGHGSTSFAPAASLPRLSVCTVPGSKGRLPRGAAKHAAEPDTKETLPHAPIQYHRRC